ncbi:phage holin [Lacticaseibacillus pantheris]|uniref:phage holin n=1 Tax=Lacticaseibacillus pantheris TaxID=171523 RepID=UPI00265A8CC5|nr:phage holin [Lacticaseibacillus pantheris]WKF84500.1 phage holin [Lacticaseibacillus pantheris]
MKINLAPRTYSVKFWLTLVPALTLLVQTVAAPFGYKWDFGVLNQELADVINALFAVLTLLGVVIDPTTAGVSDSKQAQSYGPLVTTKSAQIKALQAQVAILTAKQTTTQQAVSAAQSVVTDTKEEAK